jgi:hypothetical protein
MPLFPSVFSVAFFLAEGIEYGAGVLVLLLMISWFVSAGIRSVADLPRYLRVNNR